MRQFCQDEYPRLSWNWLDELMAEQEPLVLRGYARHWPLTQAGLAGSDAAMDYLLDLDAGRPLLCYLGEPSIRGRFFYNEAVNGFNFTYEHLRLADFFHRIREHRHQTPAPAYYIGSTTLEQAFPGIRKDNDLGLEGSKEPLVSIWMGNRTLTCAHYDLSNNIVCNLVGRRRFTLFPPDQVSNLYPGPLEPTPGGQVVSMVDLRNPDFERYPKVKQALDVSQVVELEPGDLLIYPSMWWHQVEALEAFNLMVNYWWNSTPSYVDSPQALLMHAILSIRDRPQHEKEAWRALFDYYIFGPREQAARHLPEQAQGPLAPLDENNARRLRAYLIQKLNR